MSKGGPGLSKKEVNHIGRLAKLDLTEKEIAKFQKQLSDILDYVSVLNEIDSSGVEPTSQVTGLENVTRSDQEKSGVCLSEKEALSNAPQLHQGFFKVKGVFDET